MRGVKKIKWLPLLMVLTILGIAAFQVYWLNKAYVREKHMLEKRSNITFSETVHSLQASKLRLDKIVADSMLPSRVRLQEEHPAGGTVRIRVQPGDKMIGLVNVLSEKLKTRRQGGPIVFERVAPDSTRTFRNKIAERNRLMQFLYDVDAVQDTITLKEIKTAFRKRMQEQSLNVPFTITRLSTIDYDDPDYNEVTVGFAHPITYRMDLGNTSWFLAKRISAAILLSVFIVGITLISFWLLYRNLLRERKLADIKNEFISNITHELKTPIATVSVAIEAMRSFNAHSDPAKSKEYLDISANELQRLSLLVDKVLKLSMFEQKEIDLKYEPLDMQDLLHEVTSSMRLQFEKHNAQVQVSTDGDTSLQGDRLHLVSVLFNLIDNALKYSQDAPVIRVGVKGTVGKVVLCVSDNGIGIPADYKDKVFDKFFRVPTGNLHNAKGYGLGLSYVAHVVQKHQGTIKVESIEGDGSKFLITLPKHPA